MEKKVEMGYEGTHACRNACMFFRNMDALLILQPLFSFKYYTCFPILIIYEIMHVLEKHS
jgi:hypothetical protein